MGVGNVTVCVCVFNTIETEVASRHQLFYG
jgi:hypothetical protein